MARIQVQAQSRKKTKKLKSMIQDEDFIPAVSYDQKGHSENIKIATNSVEKLLSDIEGTPLIDLAINKEAPQIAILKEIQFDRRKNTPSHLSFMILDSKKKALFDVGIVLKDESPAVKNSLGILLVTKTSIELRGLPEDIPSNIAVDISILEDVGDIITIRDLTISDNLEFINDDLMTLPVVTIQPFQKTIEEEKPVVEEDAETEELPEDGETPEEGEAGETSTEDTDETPEMPPETPKIA